MDEFSRNCLVHDRKIEISKKKLDEFSRKQSDAHLENWNFGKIFGCVFLEIGSEIVTIEFKEELDHLDG